MNKLDENILVSLKARYGPDAWDKTVSLKYESIRFFYRTKELIENDRMGEVVFAVQRPNGRFIAVRSKEYPQDIFRIPTGGIRPGEDIIEAVTREVSEELGLKAEIKRFIGVYRIRLERGREHIWFYSFFFHLVEKGGRLLKDATDDEVSEVFEANHEELERISQGLLAIEKDWRDWGSFRYLTTKAICDYTGELRLV